MLICLRCTSLWIRASGYNISNVKGDSGMDFSEWQRKSHKLANKKEKIKMGKRTQILDRGRLEKKCYGQTNLSLRCLDHTEITFVRRRTSEKMMEECLTPSVKHGGGNVIVWGCFGAGKVGDLYKVKGILNKEGYHSILQCHAIPCGQRLIGGNFLLQQDNDPKHTSKLCKNYLGKKQSAGIPVCNGVASAVTRSQPYWAVVGAAWPYGT